MNQPLQVGVLGLGQRGLQHLKALWQLQREGMAQVVALGDTFEDNLKAEKLRQYIPNFQAETIGRTTDFNDLLESNLDILYICIPPNVHNNEVIRAAKAGIHLFIEKPMSLFLDETLAMAQAIADANVYSAVGFQQRFDPRHEKVKEILTGKQAVMANYTIHAPLEAHNVKHTQTEKEGGPSNRIWTANRAWSGMTVVEGGIHPLDLWRYWFGDVTWVRANYIHRPPEAVYDGADNPYAYAVTFSFTCGAIGNMTLSRLRRVYHTYLDHQVLWTEGRLSIEPQAVVSYHYEGAYPPAERPTPSQIQQKIPLSPNDSTLAISRNFLQAIIDKQPEQIRSPFTDAMNSLAAVIGANISDELGGERVEIEALLASEQFASYRQKTI